MLRALLYVVALQMLAGPALAQIYSPKGPIEAKYQADGPWQVRQAATTVACDREGHVCDIWYPTKLGSNPVTGVQSGFKHPIISWANGTGQTAKRYSYLLRHLATWGFIVVASRDGGTGTGETIVDAANYVIKLSRTSGSIFSGKVDPTKVGTAGHSQGGATVIRLFAKKAAPFTAFVEIHGSPEFFARLCCGLTRNSLASSGATGAIMHMGGTADPPEVQIGWYDSSPASSVKALGIQNGTNHDDVMGNPACRPLTSCLKGSYGYLGYPTAWFLWRLQGAADAGSAFRAGGEFLKASPEWSVNNTNVP